MRKSPESFTDLRSNKLLPIMILAWVIGGMIFVGHQLHEVLLSRNASATETHLEHTSARIGARLEGSLFGLQHLTNGVVAAVSSRGQISDAEYSEIVRPIFESREGILNIALAPDLVIRHIYPFQDNITVMNADLAKSERVMPAIDQAIRERRTVLTGPIILPRGETAFITRTPIFTESIGGEGEFWGIASVVVAADTIFASAGIPEAEARSEIAIRNLGAPGQAEPVFFGTEEVFEQNPVVQRVSVPGGSWEIAMIPRGGWYGSGAQSKWIEVSYWLFCLAILATLYVTFVQTQRRLEAERLLQDSINSIDDGFAVYDSSDRLVICNEAYFQMYDRSGGTIRKGATFEEILRAGLANGQYPDAEGNEELWIRDRMKRHRAAENEMEQQLPNGRWLRIAERRTVGGAIVGFRVDITELKQARLEAERANRAKAEFISLLSHELRTPLTIVLGYAKVLANMENLKSVKELKDVLADEAGNLARLRDLVDRQIDLTMDQGGKIQKSGEHLLLLINDLLDYSKIEAGRMELSYSRFSIGSLVSSVADDMSDAAREKGLQIIAKCDDLMIEADEVRIKQVLINLIGNSIKFTERGYVSASVRSEGDEICIEVADTGCGIANEDMKLVFEAFRQADTSDTRRAGGTGLGLAICKRIVELHGGRIELESTVDKGTRFRVSIPHRAEDRVDITTDRAA